MIDFDDGQASRAGAAHDPAVHGTTRKSMSKRTLRVAAVQMACELGAVGKNLERATSFVEDAARQGAELVLLPELMPGGYTLTQRIWDTAEPFDGTTTRWLAALCSRLGIYAGTTFLEAEADDFFDTFVLAEPSGKICGRVRKSPAVSFEAYFFRGGNTPHWFDTPLGRIGVGICFENALYERYCEIQSADVDLYLRPFSGASFEAKFPVRRRDADMLNAALRDGTAETARLMGIPVVMANKVGRLVTELPAGFPAQDVEFPGFSAVADSNGQLLGQLGTGQEGVVVATVALDPARKCKARVPPMHGRWNAAMPWWAFIWVLTQRLGERSYAQSAQRRVRALGVSSRAR
ncbi:carbon-nitrogen hydrolase family protein [Piscinibacter sp.]|uniref:carbon-nitrogen hydrolase family protein n=1 Tax=Piscinibacter sp. TaxID=1903157 RepID=UPI00355943FD